MSTPPDGEGEEPPSVPPEASDDAVGAEADESAALPRPSSDPPEVSDDEVGAEPDGRAALTPPSPKHSFWERAQHTYEHVRAAAVRGTMRLAPTETQRVLGLTIVLGAVCGLVAVSFHEAIHLASELILGNLHRIPLPLGFVLLVLTPGIGGLVVGAVVRFFPGAVGSGVPQVKAAYALGTARVRLRDAVAKFFLCVLQLGSGAALGREGPTVQICTAVATSAGRWLALSPANLRRLIPVGAAAGIAAAFNAPIAAVTFTIEEVVGGLDQTVLSGVVVAAALAAVVEHSVLGANPVFDAPPNAGLHHPSSLVFYALLGLIAALLSVAFYDLMLGTRARFRSAERIPAWTRPAIGGLATGVLGAVVLYLVDEPGIEGGGYETLGRALHGSLAVHALALLCIAKLFASVSSYASGGVGGIFAPVLFIGAMLGGLIGGLDIAVLGHGAGELSSFALVGMGAFFAAVVRAPITSVLIIFEMTGNYDLVLPLMIANSAAYVLARHFRSVPIYEALLAQDGITLPHGSEARAALASLRVADAMSTELVELRADVPIVEALEVAREHGFATYPVRDAAGRFVGLLSEARMRRTIAEGETERTAGEVARRKEYVGPDEALLRVVAKMNRLGVRQLPVLAPVTHELVGIVAMTDMLSAQANFAERHGLAEVERLTAIDGLERPSLASLKVAVPEDEPGDEKS
ncbi:MAG: chloride channel protein [Sandaracinaceae bacterium]